MLFRLALRNLGRNRRRTALTGGVVGLGFAAFALAGGFVAQSFRGLRQGTIASGTGHFQLAATGFFDAGAEGGGGIDLAQVAAVEALLEQDPEVIEVLPRIDFVGLATDGTRSIPFLGVGLDPEREARSMEPPGSIVRGRWLDPSVPDGVVLGGGLARALDAEVGDVLTLVATASDGALNAIDATVAGITSIPLKELDDRYLATALAQGAELVGTQGSVTKLTVLLREPGADARAALARLLPRLAQQGHTLDGRTWDELAPFYRQVRQLYIGIFGFMGLVLVLVVLLAAANTMLMAATERTREIGTLRAIGMRPALVRRLFLAEGLLLGLLSCVAGAAVALAVRALLNASGLELPPPPGVARGLPLHIDLFGAVYVAATLLLSLTLLAAAWLAARRAARRSIVEALAHV